MEDKKALAKKQKVKGKGLYTPLEEVKEQSVSQKAKKVMRG